MVKAGRLDGRRTRRRWIGHLRQRNADYFESASARHYDSRGGSVVTREGDVFPETRARARLEAGKDASIWNLSVTFSNIIVQLADTSVWGSR